MSTTPGSVAVGDVPTAVYRLYDASDVLLYVGISRNPEWRFRDHASQKPWWPQVARKTIAWCDSKNAALQAEARAIDSEGPAHNISNPLRPAPRTIRRPRQPGMVRGPGDRSADRHDRNNQTGVSCRLTLDDFHRFEAVCKKLGLSRRQAIITAIREFLDRHENEADPK